ncbi:MAG: hypothetical protein EOO42_08355 [Flavobacteriales bacterium]|nr:MAG: hypothetical protein EOO42_08355 [Flavobacteriales bacterium]
MNITGTTKGAKSEQQGNTDTEKPEKGVKPVNAVKDEIEEGKIKPVKEKNPAKQREQSEQPVHSIKKAPKE